VLFPILRNAAGYAVDVSSRWVHSGIALLITLFFPPRVWYLTALSISRALVPAFRMRRHGAIHDILHEARLVNRFLAMLTRRGVPFPVPYRIKGVSALFDAAAHTGGVIYVSAHIPLVKVAARAIIETVGMPTRCIALDPDVNEQIAVWGLVQRLPALRPVANVLVRSRSILRAGGSILLLIDPRPGVAYSPNMLRLAGKVGARVVLFFSELMPDGHVEVLFLTPPDPFCRSEEGVQANLQALDREVVRIAGRHLQPAVTAVPVRGNAPPLSY